MQRAEKKIILSKFIGEVYFYPLTFTEQITINNIKKLRESYLELDIK